MNLEKLLISLPGGYPLTLASVNILINSLSLEITVFLLDVTP